MQPPRFVTPLWSSQADLGLGQLSSVSLGSVATPVVNSVYPMKTMTAFHASRHIPGLTGRWMDTGATALGGAVKGPWHRLAHGHHLFEDGIKVLVNPKLKFGEFLHHLGMDSLTRTGIPNPLLPTVLGQKLVGLGLPKMWVQEFMTVNLPKILGGSLAIVTSGSSVLGAFSDAIPHTLLSAGKHLAFGALEVTAGIYWPNPVVILAGLGDLGVGAVTTWRAMTDPVIASLGVPSSVFLPALGQAIGLGALGGMAASLLTGQGLAGVPRNATAGAAGMAVSTTVGCMAKAAGLSTSWLGPLAGVGSALLVHWLWRQASQRLEKGPSRSHYQVIYPNLGREPHLLPMFPLQRGHQIGELDGSTLLLGRT